MADSLSPGSIAVIVVVSLVLVYMVILSLITLCRFMVDKRRAEADAWRVPERDLFLCGLLGGGIGGFAAMWIFHHKTSKRPFCVPYTLLFVLNVIVVLGLIVALIAVPIVLR